MSNTRKKSPSLGDISFFSSSFPYKKLPLSLISYIDRFLDDVTLSYMNQAIGHFRRTAKDLIMQIPFRLKPTLLKLLYDVVNADYEHAALMIAIDPLLLFTHVNFLHHNGSTEYISPLKYAFKVYDTYMWKLFYEKIKNNPEQVQLFLAQAKEQTTHIDLQPLFDEYQQYEDRLIRLHCNYDGYLDYLESKNEETGDDELSQEWIYLGEAQLNILPRHMLKEFLRPMENNGWRNDQLDFDITVMPAPQHNELSAYDDYNDSEISFSSVLSNIEGNFSLVHTAEHNKCSASSDPCNPDDTRRDAEVFGRLLKVRQEDLAKQITLLSQRSHENLEQQDQTSPLPSASRAAR